MAELAEKTNVLCGKEGHHGVGEHSWDVANGLLHLFVTLEAPPSPHPNNSTIMPKPQHKEPV